MRRTAPSRAFVCGSREFSDFLRSRSTGAPEATPGHWGPQFRKEEKSKAKSKATDSVSVVLSARLRLRLVFAFASYLLLLRLSSDGRSAWHRAWWRHGLLGGLLPRVARPLRVLSDERQCAIVRPDRAPCEWRPILSSCCVLSLACSLSACTSPRCALWDRGARQDEKLVSIHDVYLYCSITLL